MTENKKQCSVRVQSNDRWGLFHPYPCSKTAIVERDGKWYCKIHDPEYIKAKQAKRSAEFNKEWAEGHQQDELRSAQRLATEGLTLLELRKVTPELIRKAPQMYEALKEITELAPRDKLRLPYAIAAVEIADKALAKAEEE